MTADERVLVGIAAVAAFAAGLTAVAQHASCTTAGYDLAVARREGLELARAAEQLDRRIVALGTPQAAMSRMAAMRLTSLRFPKTWNTVHPATVRACLAAGAAPARPASAGAAR